MDITCGRCDSRWTGLAKAHCGSCHLTFSSVGAFDKHLRYNCQDEAKWGLVLVDDVWQFPADQERMALVRSPGS